jgi:hypothetical protein
MWPTQDIDSMFKMWCIPKPIMSISSVCVWGTNIVVGVHHTYPLDIRYLCVQNKRCCYMKSIGANILSMCHATPLLSLVCITMCHLSWLHLQSNMQLIWHYYVFVEHSNFEAFRIQCGLLIHYMLHIIILKLHSLKKERCYSFVPSNLTITFHYIFTNLEICEALIYVWQEPNASVLSAYKICDLAYKILKV